MFSQPHRVVCFATVAIIAVVLAVFSAEQPDARDRRGDSYDELYNIVMTRTASDGTTHGQDYPAPLVWFQSSHLLTEVNQKRFLDTLDQFNSLSDAEIEAYGNLRRALLQRHLWAVFDWSTARRNPASSDPEPNQLRNARTQIQSKVALAMKRLALSKAEILALPNSWEKVIASQTYSENFNKKDAFRPFLPADLFDETGPWVCLRRDREGLPAPLHSEFESWRSVFLVFVRLPNGRRATRDFLEKLNRLEEPIVISERGDVRLHPETPEFPTGTQFALVERPLLISDQRELVLSPLIYRIELRALLNPKPKNLDELQNQSQAVAQFVFQPKQWLAGKPALKAIGRNDTHYSTFTTVDPFENSVDAENHIPLQNCAKCHLPPGVRSFASRHRRLQFRQVDRVMPAVFREGRHVDTAWATIAYKKRDYSWGILEVRWLNARGDN